SAAPANECYSEPGPRQCAPPPLPPRPRPRAYAVLRARPLRARFRRRQEQARLPRPLPAAAWCVHFFQCRDVHAERVRIASHAGSNNDGFDIDSCQTVHISNCGIDTGDDATCLKTTSSQPCRDIRLLRITVGAITIRNLRATVESAGILISGLRGHLVDDVT